MFTIYLVIALDLQVQHLTPNIGFTLSKHLLYELTQGEFPLNLSPS